MKWMGEAERGTLCAFLCVCVGGDLKGRFNPIFFVSSWQYVSDRYLYITCSYSNRAISDRFSINPVYTEKNYNKHLFRVAEIYRQKTRV